MIHILYRHTENKSAIGKNRPEWFSYTKSLNNILNTIVDDNRVKFHLLYDGTYSETPHNRIDEVIEFKGGSDFASFKFAWECAKNLNIGKDDLIYFLENDYMHVNGWVDDILNLYSTFDVTGYVALYDHNDKYTLSMYNDLQSQIYVAKTKHWRTVPSTCGSFIINKKILDEDIDIHTNFYGDHDKFLYLGKTKNRIVISPIPSLSTHCETEWLAPTIDWSKQ
jgi:hypothetical protein